ncbi:MAG: prepilin peptidase [Deltaproteobacteria bacterium]|nr:prepilin peptidase [Deltaproteobacteria bacterium]MBW1817400.1 prepilin peptidase [Deltaproteobacteria bacterium]
MGFTLLMNFYSVLLGLIVGSFANVCIYRIPLGKSIVRPPSSCPQCGNRVRFYDNIPLISYMLLRGRCRVCGQRIPLVYPLVEGLFGLLSLVLFSRYGVGFQYILFLIFAGALIVISFIDFRHQIIPDVLSLPGIAAGLAVTAVYQWAVTGRDVLEGLNLTRFAGGSAPYFMMGEITWLDSLLGIVAGGGSLFLVAVAFEYLTGKEGMGGGDIKLLAMIGAWLGWQSLIPVVLMSSFSGALVGSVYLLLSGKGLRVKIPFGPFLALGALLYLFFGVTITNTYFRFFA